MSSNPGNDPDFDQIIAKGSPGNGNKFIKVLFGLAILTVLFALLIPAPRTARFAARRAQCVNNLKQIALALHNYEQEHKALPPAYTTDETGRPLHSWRTLILPYLEQDSLYRSIDLSKPWNDPANNAARETDLPVYHCPESVEPQNMTTYLAIAGPDGCLHPTKPRNLAEISDPHDSTLMVIEVGEQDAVPWMAPTDAGESLVLSLGQTSKPSHNGGMNSSMVDGSMRYLKSTVPDVIRRALMTISGNEVISADSY